MAIDAPEHDGAGSSLGAADVEPGAQGAHRAGRFFFSKGDRDRRAGGVLIGLRAPDRQNGPFGLEVDVVDA